MAPMRILVLSVLLSACRENKPSPPVTADPVSTASVGSAKPAASVVSISLAPDTINGAGAFEILGGGIAAVALAVDCPKAPSGCALKPDVLAGNPADLPSLKCPGGRLVTIGIKAPWSKLTPGRYSSKTPLVPDLSVEWYRDGHLTINSDWLEKSEQNFVVIDEITPTFVRGSVHAKMGEVVVDGPFRAPLCKP